MIPRIFAILAIAVLCALAWISVFYVGYDIGIRHEKSFIMTDSLTTHCGKWTIDLPYRLDSSTEGNLWARTVGDTLYIYHKP